MGINLSKTKTINKVRKIENRISDFEEIVLGYSKEEAIEEASRCLQCKNPTCVLGCPASNNIPLFIKYIQEDKIEKAKEVLNLTSNMSEICSRVCDHNKQCEGKCIRGKNGDPVAIGLLERYVSEQNSHKNAAEPQYLGKKVAIIGSGPAGLSCAEELTKLGYDVVVFEQENENGGLLTYGIPNYRLPIEVVNNKITQLKSMKVNFINNKSLGKDFTIKTLKNEGFAAIFIAIGAQKPKYMGIKGETLNGLITSNDFLKYIAQISKDLKTTQNLLIGKKVAVIGGGNSAIDATFLPINKF